MVKYLKDYKFKFRLKKRFSFRKNCYAREIIYSYRHDCYFADDFTATKKEADYIMGDRSYFKTVQLSLRNPWTTVLEVDTEGDN